MMWFSEDVQLHFFTILFSDYMSFYYFFGFYGELILITKSKTDSNEVVFIPEVLL